MGDKTRASLTLADFLVPLDNRVHVYEIVVRSYGEILTVWRVLHLMKDFLAVFNVRNFRKVPKETNKVNKDHN